MKWFLIFLCTMATVLEAQQVEDELLQSYFQQPLYPVDANLGELYSPLQASREAVAIQTTSRAFWESLLIDAQLTSEVVAPYSKELLARQFAIFLERKKSTADIFTLRSILAGQAKVINDTARVTSRLIFGNDLSLLVTLYFQNSRALAAYFEDQEITNTGSSWFIEAVDFDLNNAEKLVDGYSYDPRVTSFLEQAK